MTTLTRRRPFGNRQLARTPFDALFNWNPAFAPVAFGNVGKPSLGIDAYYEDENFVVKASVPGVAIDDIDITLDDGVLRIKAERDADNTREDGDYLVRERSRGVFQRSVRLPDGIDIDAADAQVKNGVLTVTVPRSETSRAKKLEVKSA